MDQESGNIVRYTHVYTNTYTNTLEEPTSLFILKMSHKIHRVLYELLTAEAFHHSSSLILQHSLFYFYECCCRWWWLCGYHILSSCISLPLISNDLAISFQCFDAVVVSLSFELKISRIVLLCVLMDYFSMHHFYPSTISMFKHFVFFYIYMSYMYCVLYNSSLV